MSRSTALQRCWLPSKTSRRHFVVRFSCGRASFLLRGAFQGKFGSRFSLIMSFQFRTLRARPLRYDSAVCGRWREIVTSVLRLSGSTFVPRIDSRGAIQVPAVQFHLSLAEASHWKSLLTSSKDNLHAFMTRLEARPKRAVKRYVTRHSQI